MPIWKKLVFALVVCLVFFLMLELVLWLAGTQTRLQREDPFRGFSGLVNIFEHDDQVYHTRQDRYGMFNKQSFSAQKPTNGVRIFCLGGSSAVGFPWGAEFSFTSMVGDLLQQSHPHRVIEAINLGGISYAMHHLRIVTNEVINYQGDILIIYSGHNEFIESAFYQSLKRRSTSQNRLELAMSHCRIYSAL